MPVIMLEAVVAFNANAVCEEFAGNSNKSGNIRTKFRRETKRPCDDDHWLAAPPNAQTAKSAENEATRD